MSINHPTKPEMLSQLREGVCIVKFEKADGTERTMRCTLNQQVISENNSTPTGGGSNYPDYQIRVLDVDKMAWRSFNLPSIISFTKEE